MKIDENLDKTVFITTATVKNISPTDVSEIPCVIQGVSNLTRIK